MLIPRARAWTVPTIALSICMLSSALHATEIYTYNGIHNDYPITITTTFETKNNQNIITAIVDTEKIQEKNTTILKNNRLEMMTQTTHNEVDSEYFHWTVQTHGKQTSIAFENTRYDEQFETSIQGSPISLQGLIYQLRNEPLNIDDVIKANIIVPWKTVLPIRFIVKEKHPFDIQGTPIPAIKISIEIDMVFGTLLPKSTLWVTEEKPHILLKQSGLNKTYTITTSPSSLQGPK